MKLSLLLAFLVAFSLPSLAESDYSPPPTEDNEQVKAQGTRGCPYELGELILIGKDFKTQLSEPTLLFWIDTPQTATIAIALDDADPERLEPVFYQKVTVSGSGYLPVKIPGNLKKGVRYRVVAGILCNGSVVNAAILETFLTKVDTPTHLDRLVASTLDKLKRIDVKKIEP